MSWWTWSGEHPQMLSCGWLSRRWRQEVRRKPKGYSKPRGCGSPELAEVNFGGFTCSTAKALNGSDHRVSSSSHCALRCFRWMRDEYTPGINHCSSCLPG